MALIQCYECEKDISDKAPACPHCGAPRPEQEAPAEQSPMSSELKALADRNPKLKEVIHTLRDEGFPDKQIPDELFKRGHSIPGRLLSTTRKHKDPDGQAEGKEVTPSLQEILAERERRTVEPSPAKKTGLVSCQHCGHGVAHGVEACPNCGGEPQPIPEMTMAEGATAGFKAMGFMIFIFVAFMIFWAMLYDAGWTNWIPFG